MAIITYSAAGWQLIAPDGSAISPRSFRKASDAERFAARRGLRVLNACGSRRRSHGAWFSRRALALLGECVAGLGVVVLVACGAPFAAVVAGLAALAACGWAVLG